MDIDKPDMIIIITITFIKNFIYGWLKINKFYYVYEKIFIFSFGGLSDENHSVIHSFI